jgi:hypothetical protein
VLASARELRTYRVTLPGYKPALNVLRLSPELLAWVPIVRSARRLPALQHVWLCTAQVEVLPTGGCRELADSGTH